jgi:uncharacterized ferritin-like protein (DUF455 family)
VCRRILVGRDLASKLTSPREPDGCLLPFAQAGEPVLIEQPGRPERPVRPLEPTDRVEAAGAPARARSQGRSPRLPRPQALAGAAARVQCLARFAHHELQAIELMAWALLAYPDWPLRLRRALLLTLEEEQGHLSLYLVRIAELGGSSADVEAQHTDYLWQHHVGISRARSPALSFLCAVGLTFEQANLDFALLYRDLFRAAGDEPSALLMQRVHDDEIRHVRLAARWLRRLSRLDERAGAGEAAVYLDAVPFPLSAARAKGRRFDLAGHRQAGLSDALIELVQRAQPYDERQAQRAATFGSRPAPGSAAAPPAPAPSAPAGLAPTDERLYLLPNLGAEEDRPVPATARGFLRGLYGAWAALFDAGEASGGPPILLPPGDPTAQARWRQVLAAEHAGPALPGLPARRGLCAWLGHEQAAAQAEALELQPVGPPPEVVRAVHDKAFAQEQAARLGLVPACLAGLTQVLEPAELDEAESAARRIAEHIAAWPAWIGGRFVLKPRHGTSGRGRLLGTRELTLGSGTRDSLRLLRARGGAVLEPWLERTLDLSVQLHVAPGGRVEILGSTRQLVTPGGQILGNRGLLGADGALTSGAAPADEQALCAAAQALCTAAAASGFFGTCGVDAFLFRGPDGAPTLRPIVELNARFTTGTVALGLVRRALAAGLCTGRIAWALVLRAPRELAKQGGLPAALAAAHPAVRCLAPLPEGPLLLLAPDEAALDAALAACQPAPARG